MVKKKSSKIKLPSSPSFLIILMGALGDVSRGLCLISQIKHWYQESRVIWLAEPQWVDLIIKHKTLDQVIVFDRPRWKKGIFDIYFKLKAIHIDCVLDLQRHFKSGLFSLFTQAKYRIGFHPKNSKECNWLFNNHYIAYQNENYPKIFHYLEFTKYLGIPKTSELDFGLSELDLESIKSGLTSRLRDDFLILVLGSTWESKEWFFEKYCSLVQALISSTRLQVILLDAKRKYNMACSLEKVVNSSRLLNLVGQTSVSELAALLKKACLAVGPDCGVGHLASAVGTPYVSLFGPTSPERTAPYTSEHLVVKASKHYVPCYKKRCPRKDKWCMQAIEVNAVLEKIRQCLNIAQETS